MVSSEFRPPLEGGKLLTARVLWLAAAVLTVGMFILALPPRFQELQAICVGAACRDPQLTLDDVRVLQGLGLSRGALASYGLGLEIVFAGVHFILAAVIFARRSRDRMALLVSLMLMTFGPATFTGTMNALAQRSGGWQLPVGVVSSLAGSMPEWFAQPLSPWRLPVGMVYSIGQIAFVLFFFLFPDGRFVPRWGIIPAALWIAWQVPAAFFPESPLNSANWPLPLTITVWVTFLAIFLFAQVYRYRRVSDATMRQQTKWVVFGATAGLCGFFAVTLVALLLANLNLSTLFARQAILTTVYVAMLLNPLSIGFAILRSHLWDIDHIINRALVYSALTAMLGVFEFVGIYSLQLLLNATTGEGQPEIVVAMTTLAIAIAFSPLRQRTQEVIDRYFNRRKYDAEQVLAQFGQVVRDEVDLDRLADRLLTAVQDTVQPSAASLWLRGGNQGDETK